MFSTGLLLSRASEAQTNATYRFSRPRTPRACARSARRPRPSGSASARRARRRSRTRGRRRRRRRRLLSRLIRLLLRLLPRRRRRRSLRRPLSLASPRASTRPRTARTRPRRPSAPRARAAAAAAAAAARAPPLLLLERKLPRQRRQHPRAPVDARVHADVQQPIEPPGAQQRRVHEVRAVRRADDEQKPAGVVVARGGGVGAVELGQQLRVVYRTSDDIGVELKGVRSGVERRRGVSGLKAARGARRETNAEREMRDYGTRLRHDSVHHAAAVRARAARGRERVELVEEHHARRRVARALEHLADVALGLAHVHVHELRTLHGEKPERGRLPTRGDVIRAEGARGRVRTPCTARTRSYGDRRESNHANAPQRALRRHRLGEKRLPRPGRPVQQRAAPPADPAGDAPHERLPLQRQLHDLPDRRLDVLQPADVGPRGGRDGGRADRRRSASIEPRHRGAHVLGGDARARRGGVPAVAAAPDRGGGGGFRGEREDVARGRAGRRRRRRGKRRGDLLLLRVFVVVVVVYAETRAQGLDAVRLRGR
eukprot:31078-Pelagococcus_subviridis.AAC.5